jgi:hypothetical protein
MRIDTWARVRDPDDRIGESTRDHPEATRKKLISREKHHSRSRFVTRLPRLDFTRNEGVPGSSPGVGLYGAELAEEWLQPACADESAVGARRQVQRLPVQACCEVRGGTE